MALEVSRHGDHVGVGVSEPLFQGEDLGGLWVSACQEGCPARCAQGRVAKGLEMDQETMKKIDHQ